MPRESSIFHKLAELRPSQLRTVADRRYADATALRDTGKNERANGAMYLGGFVVECLLKASMLQDHPWLKSGAYPHGRSRGDQDLWSLCWRSHDLHEILEHLPTLRIKLASIGKQPSVLQSLSKICGQWTVFARYSPQSAMMSEAKKFLAQIQEIRPWIR